MARSSSARSYNNKLIKMVKTCRHAAHLQSAFNSIRRPQQDGHGRRLDRPFRAPAREEEKEREMRPGETQASTPPRSPQRQIQRQTQRRQELAAARSRHICSTVLRARAGGNRPRQVPDSMPLIRMQASAGDFAAMDHARARQQRYIDQLRQENGELRHLMRGMLVHSNYRRLEALISRPAPFPPAPFVVHHIRSVLSREPHRCPSS